MKWAPFFLACKQFVKTDVFLEEKYQTGLFFFLAKSIGNTCKPKQTHFTGITIVLVIKHFKLGLQNH